jgi:hypothetical protein
LKVRTPIPNLVRRLIVAPWKMTYFEGALIDCPGPEHLGFKVESAKAVENELAALRENDPEMRERITNRAKASGE